MNKQVITDLAWGLGIVVVALVASAARKMGYVDSETVTRMRPLAIECPRRSYPVLLHVRQDELPPCLSC
jgi:hypothetical protein